MEKRLTKIYRQAYKDIEKKASDYFAKFAEEDKKKLRELAAGKITRREYFTWRRNKMATGKHWTEMKRQIASRLTNVNEIAIAYVNGRLPKIYADVYKYSAEDFQTSLPIGVSFELPNEQTIRILSTELDQSFLPYKKLDPAKDIPWNMKKVNSEVVQGFLQGESIQKIAARIASVAVMNKAASVRTARTIVNTVENEARYNVAVHADRIGCKVVKMWLDADDSRVRQWHAQAGQDYGTEDKAIPFDEYFDVGGEKMLYPGDRSASARNRYNCRCVSVNKIIGFRSSLPHGTVKVRF